MSGIIIPVIKLPSQSSTTSDTAKLTTTTPVKTTTTSSTTTGKAVITSSSKSTSQTTSTKKTTTSTSSSTSTKPTTTSTSSSSSLKPTTTSSTSISTSSTSSTSSTTSTSSTSTSSRTSSSSTLSSSSASATSSAGSSGANATGTKGSENGLSVGAIVGIVIGVVAVIAIVALLATRAIRKSRRSDRRRRSGLQAWTDRRTTLHGGGDDDFFDPSAGTSPGAGVASSGHGEKPWGMEMTPSREKLEMYGPGSSFEQSTMQPGQEQAYVGSPPLGQPTFSGSPQSFNTAQPDAYGGQWMAYPQPPTAAYGLAVPGQTQAYAPVARSPSPVLPQDMPGQPYPGQPAIMSAAEQADSQPPIPSAALGHDPQLKDDMWVLATSTFVRTLEDELAIQPNDQLYLIQAYDDGWCLCEDADHARGFVPLYCLEPATGAPPSNRNASTNPRLSLVPPTPTTLDNSLLSAAVHSPTSPTSPGVVGEGKTEVLRFSQPVVLVNGEAQSGQPPPSKPAEGKSEISSELPRSETSSSLGATSQRSQRRSSLFVDATTAGIYLNHQTALGL